MPGTPCHCASGLVGVLADRDDGTVVRHGVLVAKAHAPGTHPEEHRARLALAAHPDVAGVFLPPLPLPDAPSGTAGLDGRPVTVWPYGPPVDPEDPDAAPWEDAARLLALLHRTAPPPAPAPRLPAMRAPLKVSLAVDRMRRTAPDHPATATVLRAWRTVPDTRASGPRLLCHGDFHLGQLVRDVRTADDRPWRFIDIDDLGLGDPAWDLARPAAWFAAGILPPEVWSRFLGAYQEAGGPAVGADPWIQLDVPARALTVQTAALALAKSTAEGRPLDEVEDVMIDTCARIAGHRTDRAPSAST
ncbi:phosphotransferase family protein [Streptomyces sp. NBC_00094]|uniref:phosphotransferase family protein n=1 Tax=Streptomyces sp. NBC_00094 TaxID=2903620 RepID=UPI00225BF642|nr:aminoglycoside phosphotransferase family protein [Streptomyces sp. NBC_00094]MCX5389592.1 aminoglycoside phosphotransferase family protein [Streptomyces sp. NBC_00094]